MHDQGESDPTGQIYGNYRIVAPIGSGGMGRVYRARHLHLEREVAVKLLHGHLAADATFRARFLQEARAASLLEHPHIVRLYDYGEQEGRLYLVMELLTDGSLRAYLRARAEPPAGGALPDGLDLIMQATAGLAWAHARGMVHRDVKPDNLLLKVEETGGTSHTIVKVGDFGLARLADTGALTASGVTLGTPAYMSPEQCQGREIDNRSDIYSLGVVLYEIATGRVPFAAKTLSEAIYQHVYVAPPPPHTLRHDLPPQLETVILRCLAKRPEDRFQSMAELAAALRPLLVEDTRVSLAPGSAVAAAAAAGAVVAAAPDTPAGGMTTAMPRPAPAAPPQSLLGPEAGTQVPRVYIYDADGQVRQVSDLTGNGLTVGRLEDNDIVLPEGGVSRHHLLIDWNGARATVTDLGSSNGTLLGERTLPPQVPQAWYTGEDVRIGPLRLRLVLPVAASAVAMGAAAPPASVSTEQRVTSGSPAAPAGAAGGAAGSPQTPVPAVAAVPLAGPADGTGGSGRRTLLVVGAIVLLLGLAGLGMLLLGGDDDDDGGAASAATRTPAATVTPGDEATSPAGVDTATAAGATTPAANPSATQAGATAAAGATSPASSGTAGTGGDAIAPDGTPVRVTTTTPGQNVELAFQGRAEQRVRLDVTEIEMGPEQAYTATVSILDPEGVILASTSIWPADGSEFIDTTALPADGTYTVLVDPSETYTGSLTVALFDVPPDVTGTIAPGGAPVPVETTSAGQNARLTFEGSTDQRVSLEVTEIAMGPEQAYTATVSILDPEGVILASTSLWPADGREFIDATTLPAGGTYTVLVDPSESYTGSVTLTLYDVP